MCILSELESETASSQHPLDCGSDPPEGPSAEGKESLRCAQRLETRAVNPSRAEVPTTHTCVSNIIKGPMELVPEQSSVLPAGKSL